MTPEQRKAFEERTDREFAAIDQRLADIRAITDRDRARELNERRSPDGDGQCGATGILDAQDVPAAVRAIEANQTRPAPAGSEPADAHLIGTA